MHHKHKAATPREALASARSGAERGLVLRPRRVAGVLAGITVVLAGLHVLVGLATWRSGSELYGLVPMLKLTEESNIPTFFASALLLLASALLAFIALVKHGEADRYRRHWTGLAVIFFYLAVDEAAMIHELTSKLFDQFVFLTPSAFYAWTIPFLLLALVFALSYLRFTMRLPSPVRGLFVVAGVLYVGGAIGFETLGSVLRLRGDGLELRLVALVEETLELAGVVVFIYALLRYLGLKRYVLRLGVQPEPERS